MFLNPNYIAGLRRQPMSKAGDQPLSLATGTSWSRSMFLWLLALLDFAGYVFL